MGSSPFVRAIRRCVTGILVAVVCLVPIDTFGEQVAQSAEGNEQGFFLPVSLGFGVHHPVGRSGPHASNWLTFSPVIESGFGWRVDEVMISASAGTLGIPPPIGWGTGETGMALELAAEWSPGLLQYGWHPWYRVTAGHCAYTSGGLLAKAPDWSGGGPCGSVQVGLLETHSEVRDFFVGWGIRGGFRVMGLDVQQRCDGVGGPCPEGRQLRVGPVVTVTGRVFY